MTQQEVQKEAGDGAATILFFAEAVTLAHVARAHVLAQSLTDGPYNVVMARHTRYDGLFLDAAYRKVSIESVSTESFLSALASGAPVYDQEILTSYVEEDLRVINRFRPRAIIGDFRISLSISARLSGVPYLAVSNAYWSPNAAIRYAAPDLPMTRLLADPIADRIFRAVRPIAFAIHARPLNRTRRKYGLSSLGPDLRRVYTDADLILYADVPELVSLKHSDPREIMIGPITWSPRTGVPDWWDSLPDDRPSVYVTLGSSGNQALLPEVVATIASLDMNVIVATAGGRCRIEPANRVFVADYLPGDEAAARSSLVICNGGSPATYQALLAGSPLIGMPTNLDQVLNMAGVVRAGVGAVVRGSGHLADRLSTATDYLIGNPEVDASVARVAAAMKARQEAFDLHETIDSVLRPTPEAEQESMR